MSTSNAASWLAGPSIPTHAGHLVQSTRTLRIQAISQPSSSGALRQIHPSIRPYALFKGNHLHTSLSFVAGSLNRTHLRYLHQHLANTPALDPSFDTHSHPDPPFAPIISTPKSSSHLSNDPVTRLGIKITPSVVKQIERVRKMDNKPDEVLRLSVESGGCHGFQYKMKFEEEIREDDYVFGAGTRDGMVVIDESSLDLVDGSTIDFATELIGSSFRVLDNPHSAGKGCGCGVSWQLK